MPKKTPKRAPVASRRVATATAVMDGGVVTDLAQMPVVMLIDDVSRVYRRSAGTILRELRLKKFRGALPFDQGRPLRWLRDDVALDLKNRRRSRG